eukprot:CAMPEP_0179177472 /NCGR_PEP_ID=MMETSP0796-20121207/87769_1 /TAXON_ID=73915 /ORGANISM="Pyrodinium bahamense, Strain pbaha01" /LENGTH=194 /DNA_ID=CAMNT_0020881027 /DNA_START=368 /DNA_END=949 /DNA_ORIENTATION=-
MPGTQLVTKFNVVHAVGKDGTTGFRACEQVVVDAREQMRVMVKSHKPLVSQVSDVVVYQNGVPAVQGVEAKAIVPLGHVQTWRPVALWRGPPIGTVWRELVEVELVTEVSLQLQLVFGGYTPIVEHEHVLAEACVEVPVEELQSWVQELNPVLRRPDSNNVGTDSGLCGLLCSSGARANLSLVLRIQDRLPKVG